MVVFGQRLDLMIFQDFSNFSDSVIHFAWDVLFLVVFSLIVTVPAWCSASGTWIYTHALTHRIRELMPISLYVLFFCSLLSVVLSKACSAASPLWRVPLGAVLSLPPSATSSGVHPVWGYCCVTSRDVHEKGKGKGKQKAKGVITLATAPLKRPRKNDPTKTNQSKMSWWHWQLLLFSMWAFLSSWCSGINSFV